MREPPPRGPAAPPRGRFPALPPGIGPGRPVRPLARLAVLGLATLAAWAPVLSVLFTAAVADLLACRVDEASLHPCPGPFGTDLGELLLFTGTMGWLMLVTWPFMIGTALLWAFVLLRWIWRRLRR